MSLSEQYHQTLDYAVNMLKKELAYSPYRRWLVSYKNERYGIHENSIEALILVDYMLRRDSCVNGEEYMGFVIEIDGDWVILRKKVIPLSR